VIKTSKLVVRWRGVHFHDTNVPIIHSKWKYQVSFIRWDSFNQLDRLCVFVVCVCIAVSTLDAGMLARSQYSEGLANSHLDTGFSWLPCT